MFSNTVNMLSVQEWQLSEMANCLCSLGLGMFLLSLSTCGGDDPLETSTGSSSAHWKNLQISFRLQVK